MKVQLHEIKEAPTILDFTTDDTWIVDTLKLVDEAEDSDFEPPAGLRPKGVPLPASRQAPKRELDVHIEMRRLEETYIISGRYNGYLHLLCSRSGSPFRWKGQGRFQCIYSRDPVLAGEADPGDRKHPKIGHANTVLRVGQHDPTQEGLENEDIEITHLTGDHINLADILEEQLNVHKPYRPLCDEGGGTLPCEGCGDGAKVSGPRTGKRTANDSIGRAPSPFEALRGMKLKKK